MLQDKNRGWLAYITVGASASGKSTAVDEACRNRPTEHFVVLNRDDIRMEIIKERNPTYDGKSENMWNYWKFSRGNEAEVTRRWEEIFLANIGRNLIFSDTNLDVNRRNQLKQRLIDYGYAVDIIPYYEPYEVLVKRDNARLHSVGASTIARQLEKFYDDVEVCDIKLEQNPHKKPCILVDIDGTIAHMNGRNPYDWHRVGEDKFDHIVWGAIMGVRCAVCDEQGCDIIFVSGRDGCCRLQTQEWLERHIKEPFKLLMRTPDSMLPDTVEKERMINEIIETNYITCVFDDRPVVTRMYRAMGLKTFQLGNPHIEF